MRRIVSNEKRKRSTADPQESHFVDVATDWATCVDARKAALSHIKESSSTGVKGIRCETANLIWREVAGPPEIPRGAEGRRTPEQMSVAELEKLSDDELRAKLAAKQVSLVSSEEPCAAC